MAEEVQALANPFNDYMIDEINVGDLTLRGDELRGIEAPRKGLPAWKIKYDQGDGVKVLFATGVPIVFSGAEIVKVEEAEEFSAEE